MQKLTFFQKLKFNEIFLAKLSCCLRKFEALAKKFSHKWHICEKSCQKWKVSAKNFKKNWCFCKYFCLKQGFAIFFEKLREKGLCEKNWQKLMFLWKMDVFAKNYDKSWHFLWKFWQKLTLGQKLKFHEIYLQKWSCLRKLEALAKKISQKWHFCEKCWEKWTVSAKNCKKNWMFF